MKLLFFMCLSASLFGQRSVFTECEYSSGDRFDGMGFVKLDAEKIIIQFKRETDDRITIDYRFEVETVRIGYYILANILDITRFIKYMLFKLRHCCLNNVLFTCNIICFKYFSILFILNAIPINIVERQ